MSQLPLDSSPFFELLNRQSPEERARLYTTEQFEETYIDWNGMLLPMHQGDAEAEYLAIRQTCGAFDVSPLRQLRFIGPDAAALLDHTLTRPASSLAPGKGTYVVFCEADGTLRDDALLHRVADDEFLLMPSDMDHRPWFADHQSVKYLLNKVI